MACGELAFGHNVVLKLEEGLEKKRHVIVMDNFFLKCGVVYGFEGKGYLCKKYNAK